MSNLKQPVLQVFYCRDISSPFTICDCTIRLRIRYRSMQVTLDLLLTTGNNFILVIQLWLHVISWCNLFWRYVGFAKRVV